MKRFTFVTTGCDNQFSRKIYYLNIRVFANNYHHAIIKANRIIRHNSDEDLAFEMLAMPTRKTGAIK